MNIQRLTLYTRIALMTTVAVLMTACAPVHNHYEPSPYYSPRAEYYDYWYYPALGCYYDPRARIYIYFEHDHWIRARALPAHVRPYLGDHVIIRSLHDRPYEEQFRHREQYAPERYRKPDPAHRDNDIWLGLPRQPSPERDRDERRENNGDRDRNGKAPVHEPERGSVPVPPQYRGPDQRDQRPPTNIRSQEVPGHRESPISAPGKREDTGRGADTRKEESRDQYPGGSDRRDTMQHDDATNAGKGSTGQYRAPAPQNQRQPDVTQPQNQLKNPPGHREPSPATAPVKQDDKGRQPDIRKDASHDRNPEGGKDRPDDIRNDDDKRFQKGPGGPYQSPDDYR